uniref:Spore protein YkvP/CgeB glycosyl transferase-like domain-containing protein n=1 Tax=Craspedostauros australis TaxID=1486917 RepID=A0A7R9ZJU9_9STRA
MYDGIASSNFMELVQFCNLVSKNDPEFIDKKKPEQVNPIQEYLHHRSNCTVHNETHVELWVLDVIRARSQKEFRKNSFLQQLWFDGINAKWKLLLVEYSDRFFVNVFYNKILLHDNITDKSVQQNIQDKPHIRTATRMIIKGRQYNSTSKKLEIGRLEMPEQANTAGGPTKHAPYTVRTDHVNSLKRVLSDMLSDAKKKAGTALHDAFRGADDPAKHWDAMRYARDRPLDESCLPPPYSRVREEFDVAHFWPIINSGYGSYRNDVTRTVMKLHGQPRRDAPHITIRAKTSTSGPTGRTGRTTASLDYARACLSTKIIVTTGRDAWEDHYRLMEGLAAGAMVLSDVMLSLPKGLENGTSVVFFEDVQDLHQKIEYYLEHDEERQAIAKRGWEVSMGYHRSYHRMEELVFGCPLTLVNVPYEEMCPSGNSAYTIN